MLLNPITRLIDWMSMEYHMTCCVCMFDCVFFSLLWFSAAPASCRQTIAWDRLWTKFWNLVVFYFFFYFFYYYFLFNFLCFFFMFFIYFIFYVYFFFYIYLRLFNLLQISFSKRNNRKKKLFNKYWHSGRQKQIVLRSF